MKKRVLKYGLISSGLVVGIPLISMLFIGNDTDSYASGEVIGYSTIVVAMALIFFAIRSYRDKENNGMIRFGQGVKMGSMIAAIGGMAFALYNLVYVLWIDPDFNEKYFAYQSGLERGSEAFQTEFNTMMESGGFIYTPLGGTILMFLTVFLIGFVVTIISALILQRQQKSSVVT